MAALSKKISQPRLFPVSERFILTGTLLALCLTLLVSGWSQRLDYISYDSFLQWRASTTTLASVIVAIDEKSLSDLGRWPWDRSVHAELINKLNQAGAEAIILDILLSESSSERSDTKLKQQMQLAGNVFLPMHIDHRSGSGLMTEILPTPDFVAAAAGIGHAHFELDQDGIARGLYLYQGLGDSYWPGLALEAHRQLQMASVSGQSASSPAVAADKISANASITSKEVENKPRAAGSELLNIREAYRLIPFKGPAGSFATLSYSDVLNSNLPPDYFSGRVVFVGATAAGLGDFIATPLSGDLINMPGAEVHANVYEALTNNSLATIVPATWQYTITLAIVLLVALIFPKISPTKNLPLVLFCCLLITGFSYFLLLYFHLWFAPFPLMLTLLFAYPFWSWRRLFRLSRFLNQELERLAAEPKLNVVSTYQSPQQWAQHLVKLLEPEFWEFRPLSNNQQMQFKLNDQASTAEISLPIHDQKHLATLYMNFSAPIAELKSTINYVQQLFPEFHSKSPHQAAPGELMDRRIVQVRLAIAAMRDMRQFISDTVSHMPDGVLVADEFGKTLFMNKPAGNWLQTGARTGSFVAEFMPVNNRINTERWKHIVRKVLFDEIRQTEELHSDTDAVLITLAPVKFINSSRGMLITFADITVIHEAQMKRMETINFISHDLKAPLASQLALLDNLKNSLPSTFEAPLLAAQKLTEKSLTMSDQFLQMARMESADHIHLYPCDLLDILDNAVDATTPLAKEALVNINTQCEQDSVAIIGNPELLERTLINLILNGIKFSPPRSYLDIKICKAAQQIKVSVRDHGQGINSEEIPYLFEPYRRTKASEQQGIAGSGLGLRFVKLVMDRHGGEVDVGSQSGKGSCFTLLLPAAGKAEKNNMQAQA